MSFIGCCLVVVGVSLPTCIFPLLFILLSPSVFHHSSASLMPSDDGLSFTLTDHITLFTRFIISPFYSCFPSHTTTRSPDTPYSSPHTPIQHDHYSHDHYSHDHSHDYPHDHSAWGDTISLRSQFRTAHRGGKTRRTRRAWFWSLLVGRARTTADDDSHQAVTTEDGECQRLLDDVERLDTAGEHGTTDVSDDDERHRRARADIARCSAFEREGIARGAGGFDRPLSLPPSGSTLRSGHSSPPSGSTLRSAHSSPDGGEEDSQAIIWSSFQSAPPPLPAPSPYLAVLPPPEREDDDDARAEADIGGEYVRKGKRRVYRPPMGTGSSRGSRSERSSGSRNSQGSRVSDRRGSPGG